MKLRSVIAAVAAVAVAATTTVTSFAAAAFKGSINEQSGMFVCLLSDDANVPMFTSFEPMKDLVGVELTVKAEDKRAIESAIAEGTWVGGGLMFNSNSTGWEQHEWSFQKGAKELTFMPTEKRGIYTLTYTQDKPIFAATDTYAQICAQNWSEGVAQFEIVEFKLLNSKGEDIRDAASEEKPAETTKPADTTAPAEVDEPVEETVEVEDTAEVEETAEYTEEDLETYEETVDATVEETVDETVEETADETGAADDTNTDASNKGNPDTGVAGVAVAAGVLALAGAAVVVSRKRK